jgi:hypothetical protein
MINELVRWVTLTSLIKLNYVTAYSIQVSESLMIEMRPETQRLRGEHA